MDSSSYVGSSRGLTKEHEESVSSGGSGGLLVVAVVVVIIITLCGFIQVFLFEGNDCGSQLKDGHWTKTGKWQTHRCIIHQFHQREMAACIQGWDKIVVMGDDQAKEHYKAFTDTSSSTECKFLLHPTLSKSVLDAYEYIAKEMKGESSLLVMHQPNALEMTEEPLVLKKELQSVRRAQEAVLKRAGKCKVIIVLSADATYNPRNEKELVKVAKQVFSNMSAAGVVLIELAAPSGTDVVSPISEDLNIILNSFCNSPRNSSCCVNHHDDWSSYLAHSLVLAVLAVYFGFYLVFASGATFALTPYLEAKGVNLNKFFSYLHSVGSATGVVLYIQMCTSLRYFGDTNMVQDLLLLWISLAILGIIALATIARPETVEILSHRQCNEGRGLLVLVFVVVYWTGFQQESVGEIVDKLFISFMVFLCGYCNFCRLLLSTEKISAREVLWDLLKLNLVPVVVCSAVSSSYLSYYLAPVLSLCYLFCVIFVQAWPAIPTKSFGVAKGSKLNFSVKLLLSVGLFLFLPYIKEMVVSGSSGITWSPPFVENISKVYVYMENNKFILLFGILIGYITIFLKDNLTSWSRTQKSRFRVTMITSGALLVIVYVTISKKGLFEDWQNLLSIIPIFSYILLRNGFEVLQHYSSVFLEEAGSVAMWLFVSHYHILVTYGGKGRLVLLPGSYYFNNLLVFLVYVLVSRLLHCHLPLYKRKTTSNHLLIR